ncbi:hypothetical protein [Haloferax sp. ATB1]|uniref:hypothetical protein n=1 Tax=Haloferax sp. ATB1 TaxID=1508454 RepID=UPI0005B22845|nr:hypothetical protein [Haloferax sp. ATB1]
MTYYNATKSEIRAVNDTMTHFFEKLPENETQRTAVVATMASESCTYGKVNETMFTSASFAHKRGQQLYHVARLMRANFNSNINPIQIRKVARTSSKIGQYTTIVGTYNDYHKAACAFDRDSPETVEDYYLASAALGFELLMFQYGMYYKTAFKANRALSHQRTYRVVQSTFGDEALGLMMSGSYWLVHGGLQAAPNFVRDRADEMNLTISSEATEVDHQRTIEKFVGSKVVPRQVSEAATLCYNNIKEQAEDDGSLFNQAEEFAEDIRGGFLGGEYTISEVVETAEGVEPSKLSEEQMKKMQNCIEKQQSG